MHRAKTVGMHRAKQASMHRAKASGHALCKNKRFGCSMCAREDPKEVFGGICLGTTPQVLKSMGVVNCFP